MKVVGVDPGSQGCICLLDTDEKLAKYLYIPYRADKIVDGRAIDLAFEGFCGVDRFYLEKVMGRGTFGATSTFQFGINTGMILMYFSYYPIHLVVPTSWQRSIHRGVTAPTAKEKTRAAFERLNPSHGPLTKSDDGLMDAFFIARYGLDAAHAKYTDDWTFINLEE